jgi:hypothetical protein
VSDTDKAKTTSLEADYEAAQQAADTPATRTSITIAAAKTARDELEAHMRYLKRVYIEPGLESGLISLSEYRGLGLTPHDSTHTPVATPESRAMLYDVESVGGFAVRFHFKDEHIEHSQAVLSGCNGCLLLRLRARAGDRCKAAQAYATVHGVARVFAASARR